MKEYIFEEICPTHTYLAQSRTEVPAYHVHTHTSTITNTVQDTLQPDHVSEDPRIEIRHFLPLLLPTPPLPPSTSYTTLTLTKVSTITSDVTSDITITLGGKPVKTEYVLPTTMVRLGEGAQ